MFNYTHWFANFPPELATFLISGLPISELRGAIPIAYAVYDLPLWSAFLWSFLGNTLSALIVIAVLEPLSNFLSKHFSFWRRFFIWLFERTRKKHAAKFAKWGALALITFVAIPLPLTGGWSGAVAAFVFGVPAKKASLYVTLGILIAGIIVSLVTFGGVRGWQIL
ncbi:MAG: small multi-drug export protein [bacterium]|nr:small multi-drug export protein [bacterium]